jgi:CheY-like chemotaxis protein
LTIVAPRPDPATAVPVERRSSGGWAARSFADLLRDQLTGIRRFHDDRKAAEQAAAAAGGSREQRLDVSRRLDVVRRQHHALVTRTQASLEAAGSPLYRLRPRVLIVHRNDWLRRRVTAELPEGEIDVIAQLDNGADGVALLIAEQPDLLLVEDALPQVTGMQLLAAAHRYAPHTRAAIQVAYEDGLAAAVDAGATAVFTRRTPPSDIAAELTRLVAAD